MPDENFEAQWLRSQKIVACVDDSFTLQSEPCQEYVAKRNRAEETSFKTELDRELQIEAKQEKELRKLLQAKESAKAEGFSDTDPEVYQITDQIAKYEESLKIGPHVQQNLRNMIELHGRLAQNAELRLRRIQAIKNRDQDPQAQSRRETCDGTRHRPIEAGDVNMTTTNFNPAKDLNTLEDENELLTYERDSLKESYRELKDEINRIRFESAWLRMAVHPELRRYA